jgi:hypothetical protein
VSLGREPKLQLGSRWARALHSRSCVSRMQSFLTICLLLARWDHGIWPTTCMAGLRLVEFRCSGSRSSPFAYCLLDGIMASSLPLAWRDYGSWSLVVRMYEVRVRSRASMRWMHHHCVQVDSNRTMVPSGRRLLARAPVKIWLPRCSGLADRLHLC